MANEMTPKVRFVKCAKCRKVLPEPPGVPIYCCGGCGAILLAKHAQKKKLNDFASSGCKDSKTSSGEVIVPSSVERSPDLQSDDVRDLSCSIQAIDSNASQGRDVSDTVCSSTELYSPFPEPNSDPISSIEESAKVCSSTDPASHGYPGASSPGDENVSNEDSNFVVVKSEDNVKSNGSGGSSETDKSIIRVDHGSTTVTDPIASRIPLERVEHTEPVFMSDKMIGKVCDDETEDYIADSRVNGLKHIHEETISALSRESHNEEWFIRQKATLNRDPLPIYRTTSSKLNPSASYREKFMNEGLGMGGRGHPSRFRTRSDGHELRLQGWHNQVNSSVREGSSSDVNRNSRYRQETSETYPHDKEELLRMVFELESQLKRMYSIEEKSSDSNFSNYRRFSSEFDPPRFYHHFHDPYEPGSSYSMSPRPYAYSAMHSSDYETMSDDQMCELLGLKNSRERKNRPKRLCRPIAGASPLIACYRCSELVQVPQDFLLSKSKRCHRLRCGACSSILRFSLQNRTHITPYPPEPNTGDTSIDRNCSSGEPTPLDPTLPFQDKADEAPRDSYGSVKDFRPGSEGAPLRKGSSALHHLMGYSSVTQLLMENSP